MYFVQFYHGYFGWLTLDETPYASEAEAKQAAKVQGPTWVRARKVNRRVVFVQNWKQG